MEDEQERMLDMEPVEVMDREERMDRIQRKKLQYNNNKRCISVVKCNDRQANTILMNYDGSCPSLSLMIHIHKYSMHIHIHCSVALTEVFI